MRRSVLPIASGLALVVLFGVLHGAATDRWVKSSQLRDSLEALQRVPKQLGDWEGEDVPVDEDLSRMGILGSVQRRYHNKHSNETVMLLIVCGHGGPICVHTPDVCYAAAGYREVTTETLREVETDRMNKFMTCRFGKANSVVPAQLEIYWGWSRDGGNWQAPENPRLSLARYPALFKLYVVREFAPGTRAEESTAVPAFLKSALPAIRQCFAQPGF